MVTKNRIIFNHKGTFNGMNLDTMGMREAKYRGEEMDFIMKKSKTFWCDFWTGFYEEEGCTPPTDFDVWIKGYRPRNNETNETDCLMYGLLRNVPDEQTAKFMLERHFPDVEYIGIYEKDNAWTPPKDEFPIGE